MHLTPNHHPLRQESNTITISVIVPAFNASDTILRCVNSVRKQTSPALEIIIIDDCSSDSTMNILKNIAREDSRVIYLRNDINLGPAFSRNKGLNIAKASHIAFLDADDFWLPDHLKIATELLIMDSQQTIVSHKPLTIPESKYRIMLDAYPQTRELSLFEMILFQGNYSTITIVAPTAMLLAVGGFATSRRYAEDLELFLKIRQKCRRWLVVLEPRTAIVGKHFFISRTGLSSQHFKMFIGSQLAISNALKGTSLMAILPFFWLWFCLKYLRRLLMIYTRIGKNA